MPSPLPGYQVQWEEVMELVRWARAFGFKPHEVEDLPIDFYNLALPINDLFQARELGVALESAEPGWTDIPLNGSSHG